jgi:peroxiredoxin
MLALLLLGGAWTWFNRVPGGSQEPGSLPAAPAIGHPAPDFSLATLQGENISLSSLRGRPVILNFWATWCPPCRSEIPQLQATSQAYDRQVAVVGIDQLEQAGAVSSFATQMGMTYPVALDSSGTASHAYAVRSLPTTFFIDRTGVIRDIQVGGLTEAMLADLIGSVYP